MIYTMGEGDGFHTIEDYRCRRTMKMFMELAQTMLIQLVIRVEKDDISSSCVFDAHSAGMIGSPVSFMLHDADPRIPFGMPGDNVDASIGAAIVDKDHFKGFEALALKGDDRPFNELGHSIGGQYH